MEVTSGIGRGVFFVSALKSHFSLSEWPYTAGKKLLHNIAISDDLRRLSESLYIRVPWVALK
jgi:hypothetical protein